MNCREFHSEFEERRNGLITDRAAHFWTIVCKKKRGKAKCASGRRSFERVDAPNDSICLSKISASATKIFKRLGFLPGASQGCLPRYSNRNWFSVSLIFNTSFIFTATARWLPTLFLPPRLSERLRRWIPLVTTIKLLEAHWAANVTQMPVSIDFEAQSAKTARSPSNRRNRKTAAPKKER